jgi:hypothetical protein
MHPAIAKAQHIGRIAKENDWAGNLVSEVQKGTRITTITGQRNDEYFEMQWANQKLSYAVYFMSFDNERHEVKITHSKQMIARLTGWPDVIKLYDWFPKANRPLLTETYRKLPFSFDDPNETIIEKLRGTKIFWYGHESTKIHEDVVLPKKSAKTRIQDIGHRKLFHFIGAQAGYRAVLLDSLIKVA